MRVCAWRQARKHQARRSFPLLVVRFLFPPLLSPKKNLAFKFRLAGQITQYTCAARGGKMWRSSPAQQTQVSRDSEFVQGFEPGGMPLVGPTSLRVCLNVQKVENKHASTYMCASP